MGLGHSTYAAIDSAKIDSSLERAVSWLYKQQKGDNWEQSFDVHGDQATGQTALAVYALLSAGQSSQDARIVKAIEYLKTHEATGVYALGMRCQVWLNLPTSPEIKRAMSRDAGILRSSLITTGTGKGFYAYNPELRPWSHSRAQYGVLGMWAAAQSGIEVPDSYWEIVEKAWIEDQDASGGWSYQAKPTETYALTPGMTAVGVATLFITQDYLHAGDTSTPRGNIQNANIDRGMKWMIDNFGKIATDEKYSRDYQYATLYAVERIGVASGLRYFGTIDWYDKGAQWLIGKQRNDGAWPAEFGSNVVSTCFSMLFLSRGRDPIAINKLDYSRANQTKPSSWNQRPRDVANVSRWIGRQLEKNFNWQIVNLSVPVADWHDAPVLYISGSDEMAFDATAKDKLRQYVEEGGLILGNADGAARNFSIAFRKLGQELFPDYEFRELPAEHLIYKGEQFPRDRWRMKPSVLSMSNGVRELMILIPQADPARAWQTQIVAGREDAWQLVSNIYLYTNESRDFHKRGQTDLIARDSAVAATKNIKIARLKYAGNWNPEPAGWRRISNLLHNQDKIDVQVTTVDLLKDSLDGYKIAHLTGTDKFLLSAAARQKIKAFVDAGGTLLIDSAGGSTAFAIAAEKELATVFPGTNLVPMPRDHALLAGNSPLKTIGYRQYASKILGSLKDESRLKMIEISGRPAIIFSREDLSEGLVGNSVDGVVGYDSPTATEIVSRILRHFVI
ncbi:MAG TPA: DUF4159 domain-containing protein [Tepidisphaeraceae bacterium]|nr:DUF4159 domain-containing protein [Tepidisphaeraceae bacterium]